MTDMFSTDFDLLAVGDAHESAPMPVEMRDVAVFAALTGDHHPIHTDAEWATEHGPFGRPIAHGLLVLSLAVGVLPLDPGRVLALRRFREATFKRPVAVGEEIIVGCRVSELKPIDESTGIVVCEWRISGQDERLRARAIVEILWRRGEPATGELESLDPVTVGADGAVQVLI
jgi:acyl dehydratase